MVVTPRGRARGDVVNNLSPIGDVPLREPSVATGELLAGMELQGSNQHGRKLHDATSSLKDLGIERTQSHRWQTQAVTVCIPGFPR